MGQYLEDTSLQPLSTPILVAALKASSHQYLQDHITIPKTSENLYMLLGEYKMNYNLFCSYMLMSPMAFNSLVENLAELPNKKFMYKLFMGNNDRSRQQL